MGSSKKNNFSLLTVFTLFGIGYIFYKYFYDGTSHLRSTIDNNDYKVREGSDKQLKADILAIINGKFEIIIENLRNDPQQSENKAVKRLISNWDSGVTIKEIGKMESDAAYVVNKKHMSFCIQKKDDLTLEDLNLITYVAIHELAHIMSEEIGHGPEFIKNFQFLLDYSKKIYYYDPLLKRQLPIYIELKKLNTSKSYCGVKLENSIA
jgi:hypothetical protein